MLNNVNYNIIDLDITNGQNGHRIAGGKDYIILLDSPVSAEVYITIGDRNNAKIPLKNDFAVKYQNGLEVYVYSTAVEGAKIKLATSNRLSSGIEIITNPQIDEIGGIGNIENVSNIDNISNLDKINNINNIVNPFMNKKYSITENFELPYLSNRENVQNLEIFTCSKNGLLSIDGFLSCMALTGLSTPIYGIAKIKINNIPVMSFISNYNIGSGVQTCNGISSIKRDTIPVREGDNVTFSFESNNGGASSFTFSSFNFVCISADEY